MLHFRQGSLILRFDNKNLESYMLMYVRVRQVLGGAAGQTKSRGQKTTY